MMKSDRESLFSIDVLNVITFPRFILLMYYLKQLIMGNRVDFLYMDYDINENLVQKDGQSSWYIVWVNDYYYLMHVIYGEKC